MGPISLLAGAAVIASFAALASKILRGRRLMMQRGEFLAALTCMFATLAVSITWLRPVPETPILVAVGLLIALPVVGVRLLAEFPRVTPSRTFPARGYTIAYATVILGTELLVALTAMFVEPGSLGSRSSRAEPIVVAAALVLVFLPQAAAGMVRPAFVWAALGSALALTFGAVFAWPEFARAQELVVAMGGLFAIAMFMALGLSSDAQQDDYNDGPLLKAAQTLPLAMRQVVIGFSVLMLIVIDWVARRPQ